MNSEPSSRLFVGNLSWGTTDSSLSDAFTLEQARPIEAKVIYDRYTGRSKGFGFVTYDSVESATVAMEIMQGKNIDNRDIRVDFATSQQRNN